MKDISLDIWLRGENHATTHTIPSIAGEPRSWSDGDVSALLADMLRAIERAKKKKAEAALAKVDET